MHNTANLIDPTLFHGISIPAPVWRDTSLPAMSKLLYGVLLSRATGGVVSCKVASDYKCGIHIGWREFRRFKNHLIKSGYIEKRAHFRDSF